MRSSYNDVEKIVTSDGQYDLTWNSSIAKTNWLDHVSKVLMSTFKCCFQMIVHKRTVLVHCSDGWDRTAQVCSLVQMLLDPYARTIDGFQMIVCKEWLKAGHRIHIRTGHGDDNSEDTNRSPIFMQFLDCVYQLINQNPLDFQFTELLLLDTIDALYSGRFGTFLYNNERERKEQELMTLSTSYWTYVNDHKTKYLNPLYVKDHSDTIFPCAASLCRRVVLWESYWTRYQTPAMTSWHKVPKNITTFCTGNKNAVVASRKGRKTSRSTTTNVMKDMIVALQLEVLRKEKLLREMNDKNNDDDESSGEKKEE